MFDVESGEQIESSEVLGENGLNEPSNPTQTENGSSEPNIPVQFENDLNQPTDSFQFENGEKKPKNLKPVIIAMVSVFVVLVGAVTVGKLFFNRDFMELFQGKTKYAQNIELATAKSSVDQIVTGMDKSVSLLKSYNKPKAMNSSMQFNIKLEDAFLKEQDLTKEESASIQQTVKYLNTLKLNMKTLVGEKGSQASITITDPSALKLTVDSLNYNDGKMYVHIPELLQKYLLIEPQSASKINPDALSKIKYDSTKMKASLEKLATIYVDSLSAAEMKAENNQSLTVDGVTVQGQKLSASLNAAQTSAMIKAITKVAKEDEYLYTFMSDNYTLFSAFSENPIKDASVKLTKEEYGQMIDDLLSNLELDKDGVAFTAVSYLSQNGELLAHSYESQKDTDKAQLNFLISDKKSAVELLVNQKEGFTLTNTKSSEGNGKMQLKFKSEQGPKNFGVNIEYSDCKTVSFLGSDTTVGKYVFSFYDPDHEIAKYAQQSLLSEEFNKLDKAEMTVETKLDGDKLNSTVQVTMPGFLSVSVTGKTEAASGNESLPAQPEASQVIDLSKDESGEGMNALTMGGVNFLSKTLEKDPELTALLSSFGLTKEQLDMLAAYYEENTEA